MKIDLDYIFKDFDGTKIKQPTDKMIIEVLKAELIKNKIPIPLISAQKDVTLKNVCLNALKASYEGEKTDGEEKQKRYELGKSIYSNKEIDLTSEEVTLIKSMIAKIYGVIISGQAWEAIDPVKKH